MNASNFTQEENARLISQLEDLIGTRPYFYMKFCSEERFAQDICEGKFYGNTAMFFRDKEIRTGERGQGDKLELILPIKAERGKICDYETGNIVYEFTGGTLNIQYRDDALVPIVCFVGIPLREMNLIEADETHAVFQFPFTEEEYADMTNRFGKYCVFISGRELENRINDVCTRCNVDYVFDAVEYCDQNRLERIQAFANANKQRFLFKNKDLSYQREYRLAVAIEIPDDHFLQFGKLDSARIIPSIKLKNLAFSIEYTSHVKQSQQ